MPHPFAWTTHPTDMTQRQRIEWMYATDALRQIEHDLHDPRNRAGLIPNEWHEIWKSDDRRAGQTQRVTIRLDADVVKFFRAMGPGYQPRMNRVLRAFMHSRLARMVDGPETEDYVIDPDLVLR